MVLLARRSRKVREPGFTLLELLLVVVLLLGLLGAIIFNFSSLKSGAVLDEGARQFEALIRFSAAQAANSGRVVQFRFETDSTNEVLGSALPLRVVQEVDPVGQPGVFEDVPEARAMLEEVLERVRIANVKAAERPANHGTNEMAYEEEHVMTPPISFFPDGSSDTVEITLASRDADDFRQVIVRLSGVTGMVRSETRAGEDWIPIEWMEDDPAQMSPETSVKPAAATETATDESVQPSFDEKSFDDTTSTNAFSNEQWP